MHICIIHEHRQVGGEDLGEVGRGEVHGVKILTNIFNNNNFFKKNLWSCFHTLPLLLLLSWELEA